jgi:hypothetical protein
MHDRPAPDPFANPFFAAHAARETTTIRDQEGNARTYTFPTFFTQTPASMLLFTADERAARALVGDERLLPVRVAPGRCLFAVAAYRYGVISDGMTGYNELALGVPVSTSRLPLAPAFLRKGWSSFGVFVLDLPVDSPENCHRGVTIWGLPKTMKTFRYEDDAGARRIEVSSGGSRCFALSFARGGRRGVVAEMNRVYSRKAGVLHRCRAFLDGASWQYTRLSPLSKRTRIEFGDGEPYRRFASLDLDPRPLLVRDFECLNTALYLPEPA